MDLFLPFAIDFHGFKERRKLEASKTARAKRAVAGRDT